MTVFLVPVKHGRTGNNIFQLADAFHLSRISPAIKLIPFAINELNYNPDTTLTSKFENISSQTAHSNLEAKELIRINLSQLGDAVIFLDYLSISPDVAIKEIFYLKSLFGAHMFEEAPKNGVVHIRAGDIWKTIRHRRRPLHPDYCPLPLGYYKLIKEFFGGEVEIISEPGGPDWYLKSINKIFSRSKTVYSNDLASDFHSFLNCKTFALSVSTLSWIASLIGGANTIHYPNLGLLNSQIRKDLFFSPPKPAFVYSFENHTWRGGSRLDKEWLMDSRVTVTTP